MSVTLRWLHCLQCTVVCLECTLVAESALQTAIEAWPTFTIIHCNGRATAARSGIPARVVSIDWLCIHYMEVTATWPSGGHGRVLNDKKPRRYAKTNK